MSLVISHHISESGVGVQHSVVCLAQKKKKPPKAEQNDGVFGMFG
jgi:hypothetical protein